MVTACENVIDLIDLGIGVIFFAPKLLEIFLKLGIELLLDTEIVLILS